MSIDYDGVWARVTAPPGTARRPGPPPKPQRDRCGELERFMDREEEITALYGRLRRGTRDAVARRVLSDGGASSRERLKRLRTEYFLRCGGNYRPAPPRPVFGGFGRGLRTLYDRERDISNDYARFADRTEGRDARFFRRLSDGAAERAEAVKRLAERLMK